MWSSSCERGRWGAVRRRRSHNAVGNRTGEGQLISRADAVPCDTGPGSVFICFGGQILPYALVVRHVVGGPLRTKGERGCAAAQVLRKLETRRRMRKRRVLYARVDDGNQQIFAALLNGMTDV